MANEPRVWVGVKVCGCCVAVCVDDPMVPRRDIEATKREFLDSGLSVVSASWDEWQSTYLPSLQRDCAHPRDFTGAASR